MFKSICALAVTAALGLFVMAASGTGSAASPVVLSAGQDLGNPNLVEVARRGHYGRRCVYGGCRNYYRGYYGDPSYYVFGGYYGYRGYHRYRHYSPYGGRYYGDLPWLTFPYAFRSGFADRYYDDGYYRNYSHNGSAHVEWCLNRYRSYRPRTNTWTSYSGRVRRCISPYS